MSHSDASNTNSNRRRDLRLAPMAVAIVLLLAVVCTSATMLAYARGVERGRDLGVAGRSTAHGGMPVLVSALDLNAARGLQVQQDSEAGARHRRGGSVASRIPWTCVIGGRTVPNASCNVHKVVPASDKDTPPNWRPRLRTSGFVHHPWKLELHACCAWSDAYRFIYIKHAKVGGSTVLPGFLRPSVCPLTPDTGGDFRVAVYKDPRTRFHPNCTTYQFQPLDSDCAPCDAIPRWKWLHYYVFSIVRHPLTRAISSYTYCHKSNSVSFAEWCENPDAGAGTCGPDTPGRPDIHWASQAPVMCNNDKCMVDFMARSETLDTDMDTIVDSINAVRNVSYPALGHFSDLRIAMNSQTAAMTMQKEPTSVDEVHSTMHAANISAAALAVRSFARARRIFAEFPHCHAALSSWYADDLSLLGYDTFEMQL